LVALQMQARALTRGSVELGDGEVLDLLIGRWLHIVTNKDLGRHFCADAVELPLSTFTAVFGLDSRAAGQSLRHLASASLIALELGEQRLSVSLAPLLADVAPDLIPLLYRDFLDRRGVDLHDTATYYLESIDEDLAALSEERPTDPRAKALRSDFEALKARSTPDELLAVWPERPKAMYEWLEDLAAIEERSAILRQDPSMSLASELARQASEKILILSGRFALGAPPPASANAA
jgi:hypothetical protein